MGEDAALSFLRVLGSDDGPARRGERDDGPPRAARPADDAQPGRAHHGAGVSRRWRSWYPASRSADRCRVAASHHQRPNLFRRTSSATRRQVVTCGVGFADLSGFTALTQLLTPTELSDLLIEFSGTVSDVVHADGGRVVKFIGDEVMWVTSTPELLVKVAVDLVEHPRAREAGLQVRAGLGYGSVLAIGGDYFGNAGQPGGPPGGGRGARSDPGVHRRPRRAARLAGDPPGSVDTQRFRLPGDGLRPAPVPLSDRVIAREPS